MVENIGTKQLPRLDIAVSSLSTSPTAISHRSFSPRYTTEQMVQRADMLQTRLAPITELSVSLHVGDLTDVPYAGQLLAERGIPITSIDRADPYSNTQLIKDLFAAVAEKRKRDAVVSVGRRAQNTRSEGASNKKLVEGIIVIDEQPQHDAEKIIVRTHSGLWIENNGKMGDRLRAALRGTGVSLAVEICAILQSQYEYQALMEILTRDNGKKTEVLYDLDLGHLAEAEEKHRDKSQGKPALAFYEDIVTTQGDLIGITSLNQYASGDTITHRNFLDQLGNVPLVEVGRVLGKAVREGHMQPEVATVLEFSPFDYDPFFRADGEQFLRGFTHAFYEAAGRDRSEMVY